MTAIEDMTEFVIERSNPQPYTPYPKPGQDKPQLSLDLSLVGGRG